MSAARFLGRHRTLVLNLGLIALAVGVIAGLKVVNPTPALAEKDEVCICHAAGQAGTLHFVTVCASRNAIYGQAGHFNEDGTPKAGHEQDYEGRCTEPSPSPSSSPSPSPSSTP